MQREYTNLEVWQKARALTTFKYSITKEFPKEELFDLTNQMCHIAEGCGRNHAKDSLQFFYIAPGSLYEVETQIYISFDQGYIGEEKLTFILQDVLICKKLLNGFIKYYGTL